MATLAQTLGTQKKPEIKQGIGPQQQQAQDVLTTKATGLAKASQTGPAASSQAARLGLAAGEQAQKEQQLQGRLADVAQLQQSEAQEAGAEAQEQTFKDRMNEFRADLELQTDKMLFDFERDMDRLKEEDRDSKLEDITRNMRLTNKKYIDTIEMEAKKQRLQDGTNRREAIMRAIAADNMAISKNDRAARALMGASEREFMEEIANMDLAYAMDMGKAAMTQSNTQAKYQGIGGMMSGAMKAGEAYANKDKTKLTSTKNEQDSDAAGKVLPSSNTVIG
jgi:hypothetical protein